MRTHGHSIEKHRREYRAYYHARSCCIKPTDKGYKYCGARGIKFKFRSFSEFLDHIGPQPKGRKPYELNRIDTNGHYEIGNVQWITESLQMQRRRPWNTSSPYKGVRRIKDRWQAYATKDGHQYVLGRFDTALEAAKVYDAKALELYGPQAMLNL